MSKKCSYEECNREVYPGKDKCIFHVEKKGKQEVRDFRVDLARLLKQYRREKPDDWSFRGFIFPDSIKFIGRPIHFRGLRFTQNVDFKGATFQGNADFIRTKFMKEVSFEDATFHGWAFFDYATFHSKMDFRRAVFGQSAWFEQSVFAGKVAFSWPGDPRPQPDESFAAPIRPGRIYFTKTECKDDSVLGFTENFVREDCYVEIDECDLSRVQFIGTDCRQICFVNCTWANCRGRLGVGDEYLARFDKKNWWQRWLADALHIEIKGPDWRKVAITYNELASNYSAKLDYPQAHNFDAGAMEMRRLDCFPNCGWRKWLWDKGKLFQWLLAMQHRYFSFIAFYRYLTGYGTRYLRPLLVLIASVPLFAWFYYLIFPITAFCSYWPQAVTFALQVASINRHGLKIISEAGLLANAVAVGQVIATATLITLFLFAVRRRFKR